MKLISRCARLSLTLALLLLTLAPALPAAHADDGTPPPPASTPAPLLNQPAGANPPPPPGCGAIEAGYSGFTPAGPHPIPDDIANVPGVITSTITVSAPTLHYLWDVNVTTTITHTFPGDLDIHLISPAGTVIVLSDRNGGGNPGNVFDGTTWDDQAGLANGSGLPVTDYAFTPGVVAPLLNPQAPLGALQGQNPNGKWMLVISDNAHVDIGTLIGWSLDLTALPAAPTYTRVFSAVDNIPINLADHNSTSRYFGFSNVNTPLSALTLTAVITHALPVSLTMSLVSPTGITVTLSSGNGGNHANVFAGTVWTDQAILAHPGNLVTEYPYGASVASPLAPEEALSELNGAIPNGSWQLVVQNNATGGQIGDSSLQAETATCLPELAAGLDSNARYPRLGAPGTIYLETHNGGQTASHVVLTGTLASALQFHSASGSGWSCQTPAPNAMGGTLVCQRPTQLANADESIFLSVTMPLLAEHIPLTLTVTSNQADTYPANNVNTDGVNTWAHSVNGNPWDVYTGDGSLLDGGQDAFDTFGELRVAVFSGPNLLQDTRPGGFGLAFAPGQHWTTTVPQAVDTISVTRSLFAAPGTNWLRYLDSFTNIGPVSRTVIVNWGGNLGSDFGTVTAATSSGSTLTAASRWAVTIQQAGPGLPAADAPVGYAFRSGSDTSYQGPFNFFANPIASNPWPSTGNDLLGHQFKFTLAAGQTRALAYFLYRGLAEESLGPEDCIVYGGCVSPAIGSQVTLAEQTVAGLASGAGLCNLSPAELATLINWTVRCDFLPVVRR